MDRWWAGVEWSTEDRAAHVLEVFSTEGGHMCPGQAQTREQRRAEGLQKAWANRGLIEQGIGLPVGGVGALS